MRYLPLPNGVLFDWVLAMNGAARLWILALGFVLSAVIAYLLGSFNTAVVVCRKLYGEDVRNYGSGNAGMTNAFRAFGKKAGFLTLAGDAFKAFLAVALAFIFLGERGSYVAGFFCLVGHSFPCFFGFRGGKGVVVSAITVLLIDPLVFLVLVVIFGLMFAATQIVSASSITAAFFYPIVVYAFHKGQPSLFYTAFPLFFGLFVIAMHRENIHRLLNRTEKKVTFGKKKNKGQKKK